jgi:hypothetical protein
MIKTPNGVIWLTVPVLTKGHRGKPICRIEINNSVNWRKKHWQSIQLAYKKAPFFKRYIDFFEDIYAREWTYLSELNETMLKYLLKELAIDIRYFKASEIGFEGSKSELVLDMCVKLNAKNTPIFLLSSVMVLTFIFRITVIPFIPSLGEVSRRTCRLLTCFLTRAPGSRLILL